MKKILAFLFCLNLSLFAAGISKEEQEIAQQILMQSQAIEQGQNGSRGESIFMTKDSTKHDFTNSSIRIDPVANNPQQNTTYQSVSYDAVAQSTELTEEQIALMKSAARNKNLRALQNKFFNKNYTGKENSIEMVYEENKTQKIRTRFAMATTIIFESNIESFMLGDNTGFKVEELPNNTKALAIKPLLIGIDTSLTVFTKDKKMHLFYLFSTDYKSKHDPYLVVKITYDDKKADSIANALELQKIQNKKQTIKDDYLIIKDGIAELKIKKSEIYDQYIQKAMKKNQWLLAEEIFNDRQFTYFKYDKAKLAQIPAVFTVVDNQDSPMETRVIGDYLIAETTARKFTLRLGDAYICVEKVLPDDVDSYNSKESKTDKEKVKKEFPKKDVKTDVKTLSEYGQRGTLKRNNSHNNTLKEIHQAHTENDGL